MATLEERFLPGEEILDLRGAILVDREQQFNAQIAGGPGGSASRLTMASPNGIATGRLLPLDFVFGAGTWPPSP